MKVLLFVILVILLASAVYAATDYACMQKCTASGYQYGYCQSQCSYDDNAFKLNKMTDYTCMQRCQAQGSLYTYCKELCSY